MKPIQLHEQTDLLELLPAAVAVLRGPDLVYEFANGPYRRVVGRDVVGLPLREALPELQGQGIFEMFDAAYTTRQPVRAQGVPAEVDAYGTGDLVRSYFDITLLPIVEDGSTNGVLAHAVDVTELIESRARAEELARTLEASFDSMPAGAALAEAPSGRIALRNRVDREFFADRGEEAHSGGRRRDGTEYERSEYPIARALQGETVEGELMSFDNAAGEPRMLRVSAAPIRNSAGEVVSAVATYFDVTERDRAANLLADQNRVLQLVASGAPLDETLEAIVRTIEARVRDVRASILLVDEDGKLRHGAAPSLPEEYNAALEGIAIGEGVGSCGTAAFRNERVVVPDIESDPLWSGYRALALPHGLRACWSTPICSAEGGVLGTFAVYYDEPREPRQLELELVDILTRAAGIAIARERLERERERNLRIVERLDRVGRAVSSRVDLQEIVQVVTDAATEVTGAEFGSFFYNVIREDGESYMLYTLSGAPREAFEKFPMPRNSHIFNPTFKGEGTVRIDDVKKDPRYGQSPPYYGMPEGHLPVTSYLAVPVLDPDGGVLGGLFFGHSESSRFTAEHEELVVGIASQAAIAIVNSRLYEAEQRAREEAERRAQAAFSLEHIDNGVVLVDDHGFVRVWNRATGSIVGIRAEDALGRRLEELVPGWDTATAQLRAGSFGNQTVPLEIRGREVWLDVSITRFAGGLVYAFKDVTDERRLDAMRNDLIATVSHELRTPVTAVYGAAKTLERQDVREDPQMTAKLFDIVKSESTRLMQLVEEILLASRLDSGTVAIESEGVDVLGVAHEAAAVFAAAGSHVVVQGVPEIASADRQRLLQVVDNLIDNALKYGGAPVEVAVLKQGDRVRIQVADHGLGIPFGERRRVFEKFVRLDPNMRSGVNGTGLGLYIARELVERMGGRLWVESRRDGEGGAVFVISLAPA